MGRDPATAKVGALIVVDASVVLDAALSPGGLDSLVGLEPVAPPLLWSEATSALRQVTWRGMLSAEAAGEGLARVLKAPIDRRAPRGLYAEAWKVAGEMGWAKTYDAEYVALARLLACRLVTRDARLKRSVGGLVEVVGPMEI